MSTETFAPPPGSLLFRWERPNRRRLAIVGFLLASLLLHGVCFYLFQVIYPPTISLLPPPARISVIAPTSPEARQFLNWLDAEDPALASQTQRSPEARAFQLPRLPHVPSYLAIPPQLKPIPAPDALPAAPSAMPPSPAPIPPPAAPQAWPPITTTLSFSGLLGTAPVTHPPLKFRVTQREAPESVHFRLAVDSLGTVRYLFLEQSSGDPALDEQARRTLALCRFPSVRTTAHKDELLWASATFQFGTDLQLPPATTEPTP